MVESPAKTYVLGLDLAGPANAADTAGVLVRIRSGEPALVAAETGLNDQAIAALLPGDGNLVVGLDAPLSYQPGGGDRAG